MSAAMKAAVPAVMVVSHDEGMGSCVCMRATIPRMMKGIRDFQRRARAVLAVA